VKATASLPREGIVPWLGSVSFLGGRRIVWGVLFALSGLYFFAHTLPRAWRTLNTDFPNYYLAARLTREGVDPARAYEWIWIQREKDHRSIDQRVVGLVPITPFSTLAMWPVAKLPPLAAKHVWLVVNLAALLPIAFLLRSITGLSLLQIGCIFALSFPLHRNFLYGQYYVVLLGVLTAALWCAQRGRNYSAGALVGLGAAVKVFPILLTLHFVRRKNWAALAACLSTCLLAGLLSVAVFGWGLHRTYLLQVLPWTTHGEALDPYNLASSSLSSLLHRLFIVEPQLNPHPALQAPWLFAVLHPLLQMALLAPAVLWIETRSSSPDRIALEWSALLLAVLTLTPLPASYHFTVLILPMAVLCAQLGEALRDSQSGVLRVPLKPKSGLNGAPNLFFTSRMRAWGVLAIVVVLYLAVGYPGWNTLPTEGWAALWHVKRLYALVLLTSVAFYLIRKGEWRRWWAAGAVFAVCLSIAAGLRHQRNLFDDYRYRVPMAAEIFSASQPISVGGTLHFVRLVATGYPGPVDRLSLATGGGELWSEEVDARSTAQSSTMRILNAQSPAVSADGTDVAFLRELDGRKQLFVADKELTPPSAHWNVEEATFSPDGSIVMSATRDGGNSTLYRVRGAGQIEPIPVGEARYPSVSPDGHWLAFSGFQSGNWNLYLREMTTQRVRRISDVPCNQINPSWEADSKTLLYASDCGRALWFTAICKRRILP
jgi:Glycosyltransferase family 87/WD40-like Beta Propeller Repeat